MYSVVHLKETSKKKGKHSFIIKATCRDTKEAVYEKGLFERLQILDNSASKWNRATAVLNTDTGTN